MLGDQLVQLFREFHISLIDEMKMPALRSAKGRRATKGGGLETKSERMLCECNRSRLTCRIVMRMSSPSSPAWDCGARPQPRSSKMPAADTRAAGGTAMPASTLMHSSVGLRASERKAADIFF